MSTEDIRDIHGALALPSLPQWAQVALVACLLFVALILAWRLLERFHRRELRADQRALARLNEARSLIAAGQARAFSFAVSQTLRVYVEERFNLHAERRTTDEFLADVSSTAGSDLVNHRDRLDTFLHQCDLAKFAKWALSTTDMLGMLDNAELFVRETAAKKAPAMSTPVTAGAAS